MFGWLDIAWDMIKNGYYIVYWHIYVVIKYNCVIYYFILYVAIIYAILKLYIQQI